tara:strand:- start:321 stop:797 length:477 start_codon:yes stop_codon:yes gene_type:complete
MQVIPNFIEEKNIQDHIKNILFGWMFPYYYHSSVEGSDDYFFQHILWADDGDHMSDYFLPIMMPILGGLKYTALIRAKVNCYTKHDEFCKTGFHVDSDGPHMVGLYSVNTNNGYTLFEDGTKIESIENQMVIFDGKTKHCSVAQTDTKLRINININFR